ncbi:mucin-2 [Biomphalaria glabrata]
MELVFLLTALSVVVGQTVPDDPLWPGFAQSLSQQTGRTIQDINILGLSDPSINFLWTGYKANMPSYVTSPPTTTPPPLPDLYQTSYSFSSNTLNQPQANPPATSNTDLYKSLLSIINQAPAMSPPAGINTALSPTSTSAQDVMKAYTQLSATGSGQTDPVAMLKTGTTATSGSTDVTALMQQYAAIMGQNTPTASAGSSTSGTADVTSLMQQYAAIMGQKTPTAAASPTTGGTTPDMSALLQQYASSLTAKTPSYAELLQQYNQLTNSATPAPATSNQLTPEQIMKLYSQMSASSGGSLPIPTPSSPTANTTASPPASLDQQLAEFFPQFKNLFPSSNATGNVSGDPTQMIFDTLLFGPTSPTGVSKPPEQTTKPPVPNPLLNLVNPSDGQGGSLISNHVENVFKTKASREMGCRFLPELLELEVLPTAPIDCIGKCPFPYINSQKFGVYCVCCPPGVNDQLAGMMSIFRRASYLETPLTVIS